MAHEIWNDGVVDAMFCVGDREAAWHHLGQRTQNAVTWAEAVKLANIDWTVSKQQLLNPWGEKIEQFGIFRDTDRQFLGACGGVYTPVQNVKNLEFMDTLLEAVGGAHYESAGALGKGERIWALARLPQDIRIFGTDDVHRMYLCGSASHDGSASNEFKITDERVVCSNTLRIALSGAGASMRFRHTTNVERRMDEAKAVMTGVIQDVKNLEAKFNILARRRMTRDSMITVLDRLFPKPAPGASETRRDNVVAQVLSLFEKNDGNAIPQIKGSAYNLLNAVTEYTDHIKGARITSARKDYTQTQARAENAMFGTGDAFKTSALDVLMAETADAPVVMFG